MKKLIYFFSSAILLLGILFSCIKAETTSHGHNGKCTGSSNCSACSNCSRCGHCSSGGSCGVCGGSSSGKRFYSLPKQHKKTSTKSKFSNKNTSSSSNKLTAKNPSSKNKVTLQKLYDGNGEAVIYLTSIAEITNIHKAPSLQAAIIEKVLNGTQLILIENSGKWMKIEVKKTGTIGFVYSQNVK